jgi:methionyl-tRNA formyltransferase
MRIAILCNDRLGFPALQQLFQHKLAVAVGTSDRIPETRLMLEHFSTQFGVPLQVFTKKNFEEQLLFWLDQHKPDVVLVKTFPFRIPPSALRIPKYGFINFHYAPLPEFRGSNPLFWMIRNKEISGGVSVHRMDETFDTGEILLSEKVSFQREATYGIIVGQLAFTGAAMTATLIQGLANNSLTPQAQDSTKAHWYPRPKAEDLLIKWDEMTSLDVRALVKACNPWNKGAIVRFKGWTFAITDASVSYFKIPAETLPGTIVAMDETNGLLICCKGNQALKAEVIYTEEGFFVGNRLKEFGIRQGERLDFQ